MKPRYRLSPPLRRTPAAGALLATLLTASAQAANIYWDGSGTGWNTTTSWSTASGATTPDPGAVPGASDVAIFNITTVNSAQTVNLNAVQSALGLTFNNTGTTLIQAGGTNRILTLGTSGITMASNAGAVTLGSATAGQQVTLALGANSQIWDVASAGLTAQNPLTSTAATGAGMTLTKSGAGTLTLNGSSTGFFGNVEVTAGTLNGGAANGRRFGDIGYNSGNQGSVIANGSTAIVNILTTNGFGQSSIIAVNRDLVAKNGGTITATGQNRVGDVTLEAGTFTVNTVSAGFGGIYLGQVNDSATTTRQGVVTVGGSAASLINGAGNIALDTDTQFDVADATGNANADLTVSASLILGASNPNGTAGANSAGFTKKGAGTMALTGTTANNYSGGTTTVIAGCLELGKTGVNAIGGNLTVSGGTAKLTGTGGNQIVNTASLVVSGGTFDLVALSETVNGVQLTSGSITGTSGVLTSSTTYDMRAGTASAILGGGVGLNKTTAGTVTLSGANTYTGATNVNAGVLAVNGSLANTSTTVGNGGTLQGSGSIAGSVTVQSGGTLATGNSIESLATGTLSLEAGSTFAYELNNDAAAGVAGDLTAVTGDLTFDLTNAAILTLSELGSGSWTAGDKLTLISYTGSWNGGLFSYSNSTLADNSTITFSGMEWSFNYDDNAAGTNYTGDLTGSSFVTMTAIPEPRAVLLGSLGMLMLLRRRRA